MLLRKLRGLSSLHARHVLRSLAKLLRRVLGPCQGFHPIPKRLPQIMPRWMLWKRKNGETVKQICSNDDLVNFRMLARSNNGVMKCLFIGTPKVYFFSWRLTKSIRWHVSGNKLLLQDHVDKTNAAFCMRCHPTIKRYRFSMGELKHGWVCLVLKVSQSGSNKSLSLLHFKTKVVPNRADHHNTGRCPFQHFLTKRVVDGLLLHVNGNNCLMVSSQL